MSTEKENRINASDEISNENKSNADEVCEIIDIKIVPYRFLKPVYYGPARGTPVNHPYRKSINVKGQDIDLRLLVGDIILTVNVKLLNEIMESIEKILDETLSFKYILIIGIFTKTQITVSDYLKYGTNFENVIDERYIGMVDSRARSSETIKMI